MNESDMSGQSSENMPAGDQSTSPGAQLAAFRQERGWTVEQVASQLNLAPRQIVAIESNDYASLPGLPIVRGFIRAYAKLLKVDAAPLLAMVGGETMFAQAPLTPQKTLATPFSEARLPSMSERSGLSSKWIVGLLLLVLAVSAFWALQQRGEPKVSSSTVVAPPVESSPPPMSAGAETESAAPDTLPSGVANLPAAEVSRTPSGDLVGQDQAPAGKPFGPDEGVKPVPAQGNIAQSAVVETPAASTKAAGKDELVLTVHEDSWIEIRRAATNVVLLSRIVKAGEHEAIDVSEPVSLIVGNASGVDATLRGKPLSLKPVSGNVARLNLK